MPLTRDQILAANDRRTIEVQVPEWGDSVLLSVMTGTERESFERLWTECDGKLLPGYKLKMIRRCLVDASGQPIFAEGDEGVLGGKSAAVIELLFKACMRLNGFEKDAVEEAAKN